MEGGLFHDVRIAVSQNNASVPIELPDIHANDSGESPSKKVVRFDERELYDFPVKTSRDSIAGGNRAVDNVMISVEHRPVFALPLVRRQLSSEQETSSSPPHLERKDSADLLQPPTDWRSQSRRYSSPNASMKSLAAKVSTKRALSLPSSPHLTRRPQEKNKEENREEENKAEERKDTQVVNDRPATDFRARSASADTKVSPRYRSSLSMRLAREGGAAAPLTSYPEPRRNSTGVTSSSGLRRGSQSHIISVDGKPMNRTVSNVSTCFGRSGRSFREIIPPSTPPTNCQSFQSAFNDLEINPVLISPDQVQNNMHLRSTRFELKHRALRRTYRLSDLSTTKTPEAHRPADGSPSTDGNRGGERGTEHPVAAVSSLEEQFKVLQHCRYLRVPADELP